MEWAGSTPGFGAKQPEMPQCHPLSLSHKGWNGDKAERWEWGRWQEFGLTKGCRGWNRGREV